MRKYFTRRCLFLHALVLVAVPAFCLAGWWQYTVARGGNDLSWVYTVEWPFFAAYGIYMWWKLIHDRSTPFDRLWAAKQRAAAQANGTPFYEIPGWATDKELVRELRAVGIGTVHGPARLGSSQLGAGGETVVSVAHDGAIPPGSDVSPRTTPELRVPIALGPDASGTSQGPVDRPADHLVDARVLSERTDIDEELEAYNRYLFELHQKDATERRPGRASPSSPAPAGQRRRRGGRHGGRAESRIPGERPPGTGSPDP